MVVLLYHIQYIDLFMCNVFVGFSLYSGPYEI